MNRKRRISFGIICLLFSTTSLHAQQGLVSAGGDAGGGGGSFSYSIGQIDYVTIEGSSGNANLGMQQPREFFTTSVLEIGVLGLNAFVFPNPSHGDITLSLQNWNNSKMSYSLFNTQGQVLVEESILNEHTTIQMDGYSSGAYFIRLNSDQKTIKIFKIIKQ